MKTTQMVFTSALALFVASISFAKPNAKQIQATLQRNYGTMDHAFRTKNMSPLNTLLDSRFTATDPMGHKVDKAAMIKDFSNMAKRAKSITWPRKISSIKLVKGEAVVIVSGMFTALFPSQKGPAMKMQLQATNRDVWVDHHGKWQLLKTVILHRTAYMNGQPMSMPSGKPGKPHPSRPTPSQ